MTGAGNLLVYAPFVTRWCEACLSGARAVAMEVTSNVSGSGLNRDQTVQQVVDTTVSTINCDSST